VSAAPLTIVWDDRFLHYDLGADHPFTEITRGLAVALLRGPASPLEPTAVDWVREVAPASRELLERFHEPTYIEYVAGASDSEWPVALDAGDTPSFPGCFEEAGRMVEGANIALRRTLERGAPAFHPAGGLHHAHPDRASGFCIFNDVAVAVRTALDLGRRVAYLDIDAHHGDGVMYGFYDSGRVLDIDFHQDGRTLFPGTGFASEVGRGDGAGAKVNVPLPPLSGDEALLPLFRRIVPPMLREFRPEVIVLQHGVDGHVGDALAQLQYTAQAYAEIDRTVLQLAREVSGGRLLVTGGGGYRASAVSRVLARTGILLAGAPGPAGDDPLPDAWRSEFRARESAPAPSTWEDPETPVPSRWRSEHEAKLVADLEKALGRRFPPVALGSP
jgi:acetoin utilization protein AcuC